MGRSLILGNRSHQAGIISLIVDNDVRRSGLVLNGAYDASDGLAGRILQADGRAQEAVGFHSGQTSLHRLGGLERAELGQLGGEIRIAYRIHWILRGQLRHHEFEEIGLAKGLICCGS